MDYKKKYKEALDQANVIHKSIRSDLKQVIEHIFPELKESEDEEIRKELISHLQHEYVVKRYVSDIEYDRWIAWLEKQGQKEPVGFYYVNSDGKKFYSDTFKYGDVILHVEKKDEQKPVEWNENDEVRKSLHIYLDWLDGRKDYAPRGKYSIRDMIAWLEKQGEKKPVEWSEEDEKIKDGLIASLARISANTRTDSTSINYCFSKEIDWLKSIKQRIGG